MGNAIKNFDQDLEFLNWRIRNPRGVELTGTVRACVLQAQEHLFHERPFMTAQQLLADIHALESEMIGFERKYGIRSEIFYPAFVAGDEPENDAWVLDFGEWASVYRTWLTRQAEYRNEIERTQADKRSLAGLIHVSA